MGLKRYCVQVPFYSAEFELKEAQNSNISVRSLGSNGPSSAGNHAITRGFVR